jgi:GNAT superfamily N-acetyltransferase
VVDSGSGRLVVGRLNGLLVGQISTIRCEDNYAFLGLYIVREAFRRRGFGSALIAHAMRHVADCNIGLSAALEHTSFYAKLGFVRTSDDCRFVGPAVKVAPELSDRILPYDDSMLDAVSDYDRQCFPSARRAFLSLWLRMPSSSCFVYRERGVVKGYAQIHPIDTVKNSHEIGPCFADTKEIARALIIAAVNQLGEGDTFGLNIQFENPRVGELLEILPEYNLAEWIRLARMYTKGEPNIQKEKLWSSTNLSSG